MLRSGANSCVKTEALEDLKVKYSFFRGNSGDGWGTLLDVSLEVGNCCFIYGRC